MNPAVRILLKINLHLLRLHWPLLALILLGHFIMSWALLGIFHETEITNPRVFYYFYLVTASTVGYGDLTPVTPGGQAVVSLFVIPGGIILFAAIIGKITTILVNAWRQHMKGQLDFSSQLQNHLVIMGWHRDSTGRMIDLIFGDLKREKRDVVLVSSHDIENPDPERIHFVQTENLASEDACRRAAITRASRIIIAGRNDDNTLTTALSLVASRTQAHIVCHFEDRAMAQLLKAHAPHVECHISTTTEMLVRSAQDPGSSRVQSQLLDTLAGPTQFSLQVPENFPGCSFKKLITYCKTHHDALILGLAESIHGDDLVLNPPAEHPVSGGQLVYFMSKYRLHTSEIDWSALQAS